MCSVSSDLILKEFPVQTVSFGSLILITHVAQSSVLRQG